MLRTMFMFITMILTMAVIAPLMLIVLGVWLFVYMCRKVENIVKPASVTWDKLIVYDSEVGWRLKPGLSKVIYYDRSGYPGSLTTNEEGWPCSFSIGESDVVVFGDSFAFGYGVYMEDAYYAVNRGLLIKPLAAPGYNLVQSLILMKKYRNYLGEKLIVLFICLENDLAENIKMDNSIQYTMPFVKQDESGKWKIVTSHLQHARWLYGSPNSYNNKRFAKICTPSAYSDKAFAACKYLIDEAENICRAAGATLVIFSVPDKEQLTGSGIAYLKKLLKDSAEFNVDLPDLKLKEICDELNILFVAGRQYLDIDDYKIRDGHWNKKGNKKMADLIDKYYKVHAGGASDLHEFRSLFALKESDNR